MENMGLTLMDHNYQPIIISHVFPTLSYRLTKNQLPPSKLLLAKIHACGVVIKITACNADEFLGRTTGTKITETGIEGQGLFQMK